MAALKRYAKTTPTTGTETLFTVASEKTDIIISVELVGGSAAGTVTLSRSKDVSGTDTEYLSQTISLAAGEMISIDTKSILEAADKFKIASTSSGITVVVNVAEK